MRPVLLINGTAFIFKLDETTHKVNMVQTLQSWLLQQKTPFSSEKKYGTWADSSFRLPVLISQP